MRQGCKSVPSAHDPQALKRNWITDASRTAVKITALIKAQCVHSWVCVILCFSMLSYLLDLVSV